MTAEAETRSLETNSILENFVEKLSNEYLDILVTRFGGTDLGEKIWLLLNQTAKSGEMEIFCGYGRDAEGKIKAMFLGQGGCPPVFLIDRKMLKERIENLKKEGLLFEQSLEALQNWPK